MFVFLSNDLKKTLCLSVCQNIIDWFNSFESNLRRIYIYISPSVFAAEMNKIYSFGRLSAVLNSNYIQNHYGIFYIDLNPNKTNAVGEQIVASSDIQTSFAKLDNESISTELPPKCRQESYKI